jgi:hypothetical protein
VVGLSSFNSILDVFDLGQPDLQISFLRVHTNSVYIIFSFGVRNIIFVVSQKRGCHDFVNVLRVFSEGLFFLFFGIFHFFRFRVFAVCLVFLIYTCPVLQFLMDYFLDRRVRIILVSFPVSLVKLFSLHEFRVLFEIIVILSNFVLQPDFHILHAAIQIAYLSILLFFLLHLPQPHQLFIFECLRVYLHAKNGKLNNFLQEHVACRIDFNLKIMKHILIQFVLLLIPQFHILLRICISLHFGLQFILHFCITF